MIIEGVVIFVAGLLVGMKVRDILDSATRAWHAAQEKGGKGEG